MSSTQIGVVVLFIAFAAFMQKVSGFGFGLIAVPLMSIVTTPQNAVIISTLLGLATTVMQAWVERSHTDVPVANRLFLGACIGMPIGLLVYTSVPANGLRLVLGTVVIVAAVALSRGFSLVRGDVRAEWAVGLASGVLNTSVSTNGPPLVFLLQAYGYDPHTFRGTISRVFVYSNVVSVTLFALAGRIHRTPALVAVCAIPVVVLMQVFGARVQPHVHGERFRALVLGLMFASGISAILAGLTR